MVESQPIGRPSRIAMPESPDHHLAAWEIRHEAHSGPPMPRPRGPDTEVGEGLPRQAPSVAIAWPSLGRNSHGAGRIDCLMTAPSTNPAVVHCFPRINPVQIFSSPRPSVGPGPEKRTAGIMDVLPYRLELCASLFVPGVSQASPLRGGGGISIRTHAHMYRGKLEGIMGLSRRGLSPSTTNITRRGLGQGKVT